MVPAKPELQDGAVRLRLVEDQDAPLIVELRNTTKGQILPRGAMNPQDQADWIAKYKVREAMGSEFYFAIEWEATVVGFVRVYGISAVKGTFSWGSWVIRHGTPMLVSLVTVRLIYDFTFGDADLKRAAFDVRLANPNVIRFHCQTGATEIRRDAIDVFFAYSAEQYRAYRPRLNSLIASLQLTNA